MGSIPSRRKAEEQESDHAPARTVSALEQKLAGSCPVNVMFVDKDGGETSMMERFPSAMAEVKAQLINWKKGALDGDGVCSSLIEVFFQQEFSGLGAHWDIGSPTGSKKEEEMGVSAKIGAGGKEGAVVAAVEKVKEAVDKPEDNTELMHHKKKHRRTRKEKVKHSMNNEGSGVDDFGAEQREEGTKKKKSKKNEGVVRYEYSKEAIWDWKDIYSVAAAKAVFVLDRKHNTIQVLNYTYYVAG